MYQTSEQQAAASPAVRSSMAFEDKDGSTVLPSNVTCHVMVFLLHSISLKLCTTTSSIVALKEVLAPKKTRLNIRTNEVLNAISVTFTHVRFYFMHRLLPWYERHYIFKFSIVLYFCGLWLCVTLCLYQYWSKYVEGGGGGVYKDISQIRRTNTALRCRPLYK